MPKDLVGIRSSIDRLKELELPDHIIAHLETWLEIEREKDEASKAYNPIERMGIGERETTEDEKKMWDELIKKATVESASVDLVVDRIIKLVRPLLHSAVRNALLPPTPPVPFSQKTE